MSHFNHVYTGWGLTAPTAAAPSEQPDCLAQFPSFPGNCFLSQPSWKSDGCRQWGHTACGCPVPEQAEQSDMVTVLLDPSPALPPARHPLQEDSHSPNHVVASTC